MDIELIKSAVGDDRIVWRKHAFERMLERGIRRSVVKETLMAGEVIEIYENDMPYPSCLVFNGVKSSPLHVVAGYNEAARSVYVITAYVPDNVNFEDDFITRRGDI